MRRRHVGPVVDVGSCLTSRLSPTVAIDVTWCRVACTCALGWVTPNILVVTRRDRQELRRLGLRPRVSRVPGRVSRNQLAATRFADGDDGAEQRQGGGAGGDGSGEAVDQGAVYGFHGFLLGVGFAMAGLCERNPLAVL